jgi:hypothetical protein
LFGNSKASADVVLNSVDNNLLNSSMATNFDFMTQTGNQGYLSVGSGEFDVSLFAVTYTKTALNDNSSFDITIRHASICNSGVFPDRIDHPDSGFNPNTSFYIMSPSLSSFNENNNINVGRDCSNTDRTINVPSNRMWRDSTGRYTGVMIVLLNTGGSGSQQNSFNLEAPAGIKLGYNKDAVDRLAVSLGSIPAAEQSFLDLAAPGWRNLIDPANMFKTSLNIANTNLPAGQYTNFQLSFELDCVTRNIGAGDVKVAFYDVDHGIYQGTGSYPDLWFRLLRQPKAGGPLEYYQSVQLVGGDKGVDIVDLDSLSDQYMYFAGVYGLSRPNALQFSIGAASGINVANDINPVCLNRSPTVTVSVSCSIISGTANGTLSASYTATDADGDTVTGTASGSLTGTHVGNSHTFSGTVVRRSAAYSVTISVDDGRGGTASGTGSDTCDLPADPTITIGSGSDTNCERLTFRITDSEGFRYDTELQVNNANASPQVQRNNVATDTDIVFNEVAQWRDFNARNFRVVAVNRSLTSVSGTSANTSIGPCLRMTCGGATLQPIGSTVLEVNRPFDIALGFITKQNYGNTDLDASIGTRGNPENYNVNLDITPAPGARPANPVVSGATVVVSNTNPLSHTITGFQASSTPTDYTVTYGLDSPNNNADVSCPASGTTIFRSSNMPYMQSFLGDVIAGYGIKADDGSCTTQNSNVRANVGTSLTNSTEIVGSGSQAAVFARGVITGFRSAITESGQNAVPWLKTFANTPGPSGTSAQYGGNFDSSLCLENWLDDRPATPVSYSPSVELDLSTVRGTVRYSAGAPIRMFSSAPITGSRKIFVDGDVIIGNDQPTIVNETTWSSIYDIPSTTIVATGNIYIDDNLTSLDAVLVSEGTVFTCAPTRTVALPLNNQEISGVADPSFYEVGGACNTTSLTMNGAIIASSVRLWRTGGTLSRALNALGTEVNSSGNQNFVNGLTRSETFRLSPEVFLSPRIGDTPTNGVPGQKQFDSLISLPPAF